MSERRAYWIQRPYWLLALAAAIVVGAPFALAVGLSAVALVAETALRRLVAVARSPVLGEGPAPAGLLIGSDERGDGVRLTDEQLAAHALIVGASGAGKSTTLLSILTDHIRRGRPVVAVDLKGSPAFARVLSVAAADAGRECLIWTPDGPEQWNPLAHGNATELKDKLMATERFTEPHYERAAERYVQTVLQVLLSSRPGHPPTLEDVVALMDPRRLAGALRDAQQPLAERVQDYLVELTPDQVSAVRGLGTRLAVIAESHTGAFLRGGEPRSVDVRTAVAGGQVVLFSLNSSKYGKLAAQLGTLAVQDLVTAVGERMAGATTGQPLALIAIDEFSALGADNVIGLLARGREARVSVLLATQELADLDRAARGLRDQVLGNTAVKIAHRQDVPSSAQTISQIIGTRSAWEHSYQTTAGALLPRRDTGRGTRRQVEEPIVHPNAIKTLNTGHAVLITRLPVASARTVHVMPPPGVRAEGNGVERPGLERD